MLVFVQIAHVSGSASPLVFACSLRMFARAQTHLHTFGIWWEWVGVSVSMTISASATLTLSGTCECEYACACGYACASTYACARERSCRSTCGCEWVREYVRV